MAGYAGVPLPRKLGIKACGTVCLVHAPKGFAKTLGVCPEGSKFVNGTNGRRDLTIWFLRSLAELRAGMKRAVAAAQNGPVWFAWPKQASGVETDLTQQAIREAGLAAGIVDYKICSIDATWSGLLFGRRRKKQHAGS